MIGGMKVVKRILGVLLLLSFVAGCGPSTALQDSKQQAFLMKSAAENLYISIRRAWHEGKVTDEEMTAARKAIEKYYQAQTTWYEELVAAEKEKDYSLSKPGRRQNIAKAMATVSDVIVELTRIWGKVKKRSE